MSDGPKSPSFAFNEHASDRSPVPERGLTFIIRTDAAFATAMLRKNIIEHIQNNPGHDWAARESLAADVVQVLHKAYQEWGHNILGAKAQFLDYTRYGLEEPEDKSLHIHFYNARALTQRAIGLALANIQASPDYDPNLPVLFISLDDMIQKDREPWADIGFSRLFDTTGKQQFGYTGRPGMAPLSQQIEDARRQLEQLSRQYGRKIPVVLLEDNVRHARMMNWVIDLLDKQGLFEHSELAGISTCFCCATDEERGAIRHDGQVVPLTVVIDYERHLVDVATPRDLLLDGFVVDLGSKHSRLPGIFMDVVERFKIDPRHADDFRRCVLDINIQFCETLERELGLKLPLSWFNSADAITQVRGVTPETSMLEIMTKMRSALPQAANDNKTPSERRQLKYDNAPDPL